MKPYFEDETVTLCHGDCIEVMRALEPESVGAIVTDPPYGLEFMGKEWDRPWAGRGDHPASARMTRGGFQSANGYRNRETPTYGKPWANKRCRKCGHIASGGSPCQCADPEWSVERGHPALPMRGFQGWCETWATEALRALKPGGHLLAFGGTRTYHRMVCGVEDAGFEIRDGMLYWGHAQGFPKSLDVSKAIDKAAGVKREVIATTPSGGYKRLMVTNAEAGFRPDDYYPEGNKFTSKEGVTNAAKQWQGWGTALKPAYETIVVARKPLAGTVAENVQRHGTGALNIDGCRIHTGPSSGGSASGLTALGQGSGWNAHANRTTEIDRSMSSGRWPANVVLGCACEDEHDPDCAVRLLDEQGGERQSGIYTGKRNFPKSKNAYGQWRMRDESPATYGDSGGASRFFYCAKASRSERGHNNHPTVKPVDLMRWLVRLVTPPQGIVLDPFAGSGTTLIASLAEGFRSIGIERETEYMEIIRRRIGGVQVGLPLEEMPA